MTGMADAWHTGFVVASVEETIAAWSGVLDTAWTPVQEYTARLRTPDGLLDADMRLAFTRDGPHRLEIIEPVPDSIWQTPAGRSGPSTAHHIAFWTDDLAGTAERMAAVGAALLVTGYDGTDSLHNFTYHRLPDGTIVESVDARARRAFERWFAGGPFPRARPRRDEQRGSSSAQ